MRLGLVAVFATLLLIPGSVFAFQFNAPPSISYLFYSVGTFFSSLVSSPVVASPPEAQTSASAAATTPAPSTAPTQTPSNEATLAESAPTPSASALAEPTERTVYLQPHTIERTIVQSAPLPDDLVHTALLAELLAAFQSKISAQIAAITTPPPFPQQVAAGGSGVLTYGAAAAASSGSSSSGGISLSDVNAMVAAAIQAALSAIDHLTANTVTATNADGDYAPRHGYCDA